MIHLLSNYPVSREEWLAALSQLLQKIHTIKLFLCIQGVSKLQEKPNVHFFIIYFSIDFKILIDDSNELSYAWYGVLKI